MTVVEIWPGNGWYTEILAPFLKDHGKLYEAVGGGAGAKAFEEKLKADPAVYGKVDRNSAAASGRNRNRPRRNGGYGSDVSQRSRLASAWQRRKTTSRLFTAH